MNGIKKTSPMFHTTMAWDILINPGRNAYPSGNDWCCKFFQKRRSYKIGMSE
jgi:hypothetical protein